MSNIKIKYRIFFLTAAAIVGMLAFPGFLLVEKRQISSEMERLNRLARLGPAISALVHELRKERGMSAGFIGSKGQKFTQKLPAQRRLTNEKRAALGSTFEAFEAGRLRQPARRQGGRRPEGGRPARRQARPGQRPFHHHPADGHLLHADHRRAAIGFAASRCEPRLFQMAREMQAAASPRGGSTAQPNVELFAIRKESHETDNS